MGSDAKPLSAEGLVSFREQIEARGHIGCEHILLATIDAQAAKIAQLEADRKHWADLCGEATTRRIASDAKIAELEQFVAFTSQNRDDWAQRAEDRQISLIERDALLTRAVEAIKPFVHAGVMTRAGGQDQPTSPTRAIVVLEADQERARKLIAEIEKATEGE